VPHSADIIAHYYNYKLHSAEQGNFENLINATQKCIFVFLL